MNNASKLMANKGFAKLILANAIGRFADSLDAITFSWLMYQVSGSATLIALIFAANYIPTILLQPFTGVLADRNSKKRIIALCDYGRAFLAILTCLLFLSERLLPWMLFPLTIGVSTLEAFRIPAGSAMIPALLAKEQLKPGVALNLTLRRICEAAGTAAAGIIIAATDCSAALALDGLLFILSGAFVYSIQSPKEDKKARYTKQSVASEFVQGIRYLHGKKQIVFLVFMTAAFNFLSVPYTAFQSVFFGGALQFAADKLSFCNTALLLGTSLGAFLITKMNGRMMKEHYAHAACLSLALFLPYYLGLAYVNNITSNMLRLITVVGLYSVCGLVTGFFSVLIGSKLMEEVESVFFGRISGLSCAIGLSMVPVSSLLCSSLTVYMDVSGIYRIVAACSIAFILVNRLIFHQCFHLSLNADDGRLLQNTKERSISHE